MCKSAFTWTPQDHDGFKSVVFHIRQKFDHKLHYYLINEGGDSFEGHMEPHGEGTNFFFKVNLWHLDLSGHALGTEFKFSKTDVIAVLPSPFGNIAPVLYLLLKGMGNLGQAVNVQDMPS